MTARADVVRKVMANAGLVIVAAIVAPAQAALFRIARQFATALARPARLVAAALDPELARLKVADDHAGLWRLGAQSTSGESGCRFRCPTCSKRLNRPFLSGSG